MKRSEYMSLQSLQQDEDAESNWEGGHALAILQQPAELIVGLIFATLSSALIEAIEKLGAQLVIQL